MTDNFKCIYKILRCLEAAMDYSEFDTSQIGYEALDVSKERWAKYIEMMADAGYIKGVYVYSHIRGDTLADISKIRITLKGLEYLSENAIMQRQYRVTKGIVELIP